MKNKLNIYYDKQGDFLEIRIGKPTKSYYKDLGKDIFQRIDKRTREIKGFAVFNFKKRTEKLNGVQVPIPKVLKINA